MARDYWLPSGSVKKDAVFVSEPPPMTDWDDLNELMEEDIWGENLWPGEAKEVSVQQSFKENMDPFDSRRSISNHRRCRLSVELDTASGRARAAARFSTLSSAQNGGPGQAARRENTAGNLPAGTSKLMNIPQPHGGTTSDYSKQQRQLMQQSAPVKVPVWTKMEEEDEDEVDEDGEARLPPHELLAREYAKSQATTFSVFEGAGRTLKGMDLRRVRNAVWRQTGFID